MLSREVLDLEREVNKRLNAPREPHETLAKGFWGASSEKII